jgi:hypothetical protein
MPRSIDRKCSQETVGCQMPGANLKTIPSHISKTTRPTAVTRVYHSNHLNESGPLCMALKAPKYQSIWPELPVYQIRRRPDICRALLNAVICISKTSLAKFPCWQAHHFQAFMFPIIKSRPWKTKKNSPLLVANLISGNLAGGGNLDVSDRTPSKRFTTSFSSIKVRAHIDLRFH